MGRWQGVLPLAPLLRRPYLLAIRILGALARHSSTGPQLRMELGIAGDPSKVDVTLRRLHRQGLLMRVPTSPKRFVYGLTDEGWAMMDELRAAVAER